MEYISSSIFGRFIGSPTVIKISDSGISIDLGIPNEDENRFINIRWEDLIVPPLFHLSFFGQIFSFKTTSKNYTFTMLSYRSKRKKKAQCEKLWASASINRVETLLVAINKITCNRYLRQSTIESINTAVYQELPRWLSWFPLCDFSKLDNANNSKIKLSKSFKQLAIFAQQLQQLSYYQHWKERGVDACRELYINKQLQVHKFFFDNVESNPLTLSQRRACIIDNDNNLLLAGAGTGKTSVMVGRTGYLINSLQAKHDEILLLAYSRKAAEEMDDRIKDKLSTGKISASTFHRLGMNIIAQVEGVAPNISAFAENEKAKDLWIQSYFEKLLSDDVQYCELILEYFSRYHYIERSTFDFTSLGDCYQYFNDNDIRTFKGEQVKNFGELYIANQLFSQGINYQYKAKYAHDVKTIDRRHYRPAFFLPELNLYIDYYEIDKSGNAASYIDQESYHEVINHNNDTHLKFKTDYLTFTYAQHKQGKLLSTLMDSLTERKAEFDALSTELILATLIKSGKITALGKTLSQLVGLYKSACLDNALKKKVIADSTDPEQTKKALILLKPILTAYEKHLKSHAEIDFEDMINKALTYVQTGKFKSPWRYIMVDEFQDISEPRARLVKALRDNNKECSVFAVGDDWQAIYRFSGADITLTTGFSTYFGTKPGATTQSTLDQTFRFNNQIGKVATDFVSKNPAQIHKTIHALKQVNASAVSLLKRDSSQGDSQKTTIIDEMENGAIDEILMAISAKICKPVTVYLLARFWFLLPNNIDLKRLNNQYPLLTIVAQSFHASKGKEADYVVIVGLKKGAYGFPSEKTTPALLDSLLARKETFQYAEERRLFYVALTRAKDRVYIIADMTEANLFVKELVDEHHIELDEFEATLSQSHVEAVNCLACETGVLKKRTGQFGTFYACSHSPRCDYKEKPCSKCESLVTRRRYPGFKLCLNDSCNSLIPVCKKCNAEMVLRTGKNGEFWGCRNYQGNEPLSCKNGMEHSKVKWPEMSHEGVS